MKITLGTNIASLGAQRHLDKTSNSLAQVFSRLSSGQRINRAADDAAGLSIADSLRADSRIFTQGIKNLNNGISLLSVADSTLEQLSEIVVRLEELAEQAANGVYGTKQRQAMDQEAQALKDEYLRVSRSAEFNGLGLFDGSVSQLRLQGGIGIEGSLSIGLGGKMGDGTFSDYSTFSTGNNESRSISVADFDNDGILDFATGSRANDTITIFKGLAGGQFSAGSTLGSANNPFAIETADVNNDGNIDIIVAGEVGSGVSVHLGNGDGSFQNDTSFTTGTNPTRIEIADFNGDGKLDIATANIGTDDVGVLLGNGDGSFQSHTSVAAGAGVRGLTTGDYNGDGIIDLVAGNAFAGTLSVVLGNGDGSFQSVITVGSGGGPRNLLSADFNGDGKLDIAAANSTDNTLSLLLGNGDGSFQSQIVVATGNDPQGLVSGDFNGDGVVDIAVSNNTSQNISILLGDGQGNLAEDNTVGSGISPFLIATGDFNSDGILDIFAPYASSVSLFSGNSREGLAPLLDFTLDSQVGAKTALSEFKEVHERLVIQRGEIGVHQSRVEIAANVLIGARENFKSSESIIRDADIASDAAHLVRNSILQQASSRVLAQANLQPQLVLQLLN